MFNYHVCSSGVGFKPANSFISDMMSCLPDRLHSGALLSGRALLDWLCLHPGDSSSEEEAKQLCQRMLAQGLLQPFSDGVPELQAAFAVRCLLIYDQNA